ncbi:ribonuclease H-like domain-containing protein [Mycena galericulata]|nr:ribonuclease H-like domain-containing protein [Mycena galericulata]
MDVCECCGEATTARLVAITPELPGYNANRTFRYIANVYEADNALRKITKGRVGFDTEFITKATAQITREQGTQSERLRHEVAGRPSEGEVNYDLIDWTAAKLCVVQVAVTEIVYIIDVKLMRGFPRELRRIVESNTIAKVGVGLNTDGRVLWDETGIDASNFVDVGLMAKYGDPERYMDEDGTGISLERSVRDILGFYLDKTHRTDWEWDNGMSSAQLLYAGLDAQASLEVYLEVKELIHTKAQSLGRIIPEDWYTFDCLEGKPVRRQQTVRGDRLQWASNLCPWYKKGRFQGYFM